MKAGNLNGGANGGQNCLSTRRRATMRSIVGCLLIAGSILLPACSSEIAGMKTRIEGMETRLDMSVTGLDARLVAQGNEVKGIDAAFCVHKERILDGDGNVINPTTSVDVLHTVQPYVLILCYIFGKRFPFMRKTYDKLSGKPGGE